jgi:hypothetical protein
MASVHANADCRSAQVQDKPNQGVSEMEGTNGTPVVVVLPVKKELGSAPYYYQLVMLVRRAKR